MSQPKRGKDGETIGDVKLSVDEAQLEQLVQDFNVTVNEILGDEKSDKIRLEYEKLYRALKKSREAEKRLMNKCRDLHAELMKNTSKVAAMADDANQMASLQKENKRAWDMVDEMKRKDIETNDKLLEARGEVSRLTKLLERTGGLDIDTDKYSFKDLVKLKADLEAKLAEQQELLALAQAKLVETVEGSKHFEEERQDLNSKIVDLSYEINGKAAELQREGRRREKLESDLRKAKEDAEEKGEEIKRLMALLEKTQQEMQQNEVTLKEQKIIADRCQKEAELANEQLAKAHDEYDKAASRATAVGEELQDTKQAMKTLDDELTTVKTDLAKALRMRDALQRKIHQTEEGKKEVEEERDMFQTQAMGLEKTVDGLKKQIEAEKKVLSQSQRERDVLDANCRKAVNEVTKQTSLAKQGDQQIRNLDFEISNYRAEAQKQRQIIYQLEKDRDRYINEAADLTQKVLKHIEELKIRESEIFDLKKRCAEADTRLKQQQNMYEAVRSDRNLYSKNLMESQDEITDVRRKLQVSQHAVEQLREEANMLEQNLSKERLEKQNIIAERDMTIAETKKMRAQLADVKEYILREQQESARLLKIIKESDQLATLQKKQLESVTAERDILGTQLIRRNDELTLLYEKIKIQQAVLDKGERGYYQRIEDIRILKLQIRQLRRELRKAQTTVTESYELRQEYFHLQRELLREKAKCKAMEEELARPLNIHRWRRLQGTDPSTFELVKKVQFLQRRLIHKVSVLARANNLIQEKDRLYLELKRILSRQPGIDVVEKISTYQAELKSRTRQMQAMAGELNMYEMRANENHFEVDRVVQELAGVKKKYFLEKKKNLATMDAFHILKQATMAERQASASNSRRNLLPPARGPHRNNNQRRLPAIVPRPQMERFAGGGFNLRANKIVSTGVSTKAATTPNDGSDFGNIMNNSLTSEITEK